MLKRNDLDFIAQSDHCSNGLANFDVQWRGLHDGKLFIPGFEMKEGVLAFGVRPGTILSNQTDSAVLARNIAAAGGLLFFAHPEESRRWEDQHLVGMEIFNIHTEFKRAGGSLWRLLPDLILNQGSYPEHVLNQFFDQPTPFLERWDRLNRGRHITGIPANDCHQNVGIRATCTSANVITMEDTGGKRLGQIKLNFITGPLVHWFFGPISVGRPVFTVQLDPYERMSRVITTHVLAGELSEASVLDSLKAGRVFVGFDMIAPSAGFIWKAEKGTNEVVMGEKIKFRSGIRLHALSPLPCQFSVVQDGIHIYQAEGREMYWEPVGPGKYRVEADLKVLGGWVQWVYANPIELE